MEKDDGYFLRGIDFTYCNIYI